MTNTELNERRHKYFNIIIESRITGDASAIFEYLAEDCTWGGATGKTDVIEFLQHINTEYKHESTLVQLVDHSSEPGITDRGDKVFFMFPYDKGEICMYDVTIYNTLLFRLKLDENGLIKEFYGTVPLFFQYEPLKQNEG